MVSSRSLPLSVLCGFLPAGPPAHANGRAKPKDGVCRLLPRSPPPNSLAWPADRTGLRRPKALHRSFERRSQRVVQRVYAFRNPGKRVVKLPRSGLGSGRPGGIGRGWRPRRPAGYPYPVPQSPCAGRRDAHTTGHPSRGCEGLDRGSLRAAIAQPGFGVFRCPSVPGGSAGGSAPGYAGQPAEALRGDTESAVELAR